MPNPLSIVIPTTDPDSRTAGPLFAQDINDSIESLRKVLSQKAPTPFDFGAVGDGETLDSAAVASCAAEGCVLLPEYDPNGQPYAGFLIDEPLDLVDHNAQLVSGKGAKLIAADAIPMIRLGPGYSGGRARNQFVLLPELDGAGLATAGVLTRGLRDSTVMGGYIHDIKGGVDVGEVAAGEAGLGTVGAGLEVGRDRPSGGGDFENLFVGQTIKRCRYPVFVWGDANQTQYQSPRWESCEHGAMFDYELGSVVWEVGFGNISWCGPWQVCLHLGSNQWKLRSYIELGQPAYNDGDPVGPDIATDVAVLLGDGGPMGPGELNFYAATQTGAPSGSAPGVGVATHMVDIHDTIQYLDIHGCTASGFATAVAKGTEPSRYRWEGNVRNGSFDRRPATWTKGTDFDPAVSYIPGIPHFTSLVHAGVLAAGAGGALPATKGGVLLIEIDGVGQVGVPFYPLA